ncbi:MAG: RES family NAD+ phosphorylase [Gammaproteobacteria bacterium]
MSKVPREPSLDRLKSLDPEVAPLEAGAILWRIYFRGGRHPTRWSDFRHVGPIDARFDHHLGDEPVQQERAVLYAAAAPVTCFAEVFQKTRVINRWHKDPWLVGFEIASTIQLLDLTGAFPTRAGASMGLMTGPRSVSRNWARAFYDAWAKTAGLCYPSSMHANRPAMVLTDRAAASGVMPAQPSFHRSLGDPAILSFLKNAAHTLGYALS